MLLTDVEDVNNIVAVSFKKILHKVGPVLWVSYLRQCLNQDGKFFGRIAFAAIAAMRPIATGVRLPVQFPSVNPAKTAEPIRDFVWGPTWVDQMNYVVDGSRPKGNKAILGGSCPATEKHCKSLLRCTLQKNQ